MTDIYSNLAFDWINLNIYYLMQGVGDDDRLLYMMDIDGRKKVRLAPAYRAQTLAVDPREQSSTPSRVFYATRGGISDQSGQIVTCDLSGSGHKILLSEHIFNVSFQYIFKKEAALFSNSSPTIKIFEMKIF